MPLGFAFYDLLRFCFSFFWVSAIFLDCALLFCVFIVSRMHEVSEVIVRESSVLSISALFVMFSWNLRRCAYTGAVYECQRKTADQPLSNMCVSFSREASFKSTTRSSEEKRRTSVACNSTREAWKYFGYDKSCVTSQERCLGTNDTSLEQMIISGEDHC